MTAKFRQIIEQLKALITFKVDKSMTDEDFIANVDAINVLCNLYDNLGIDRSEIRKNMDKLYPEFTRRVYGKSNIQQSMSLIKALCRYIYDRGYDKSDRGPVNRQHRLVEMCCKFVASYKENPIAHASDYLWSLDTVLRSQEFISPDEYKTCNDIVNSLLQDIDNVTDNEKVRRAYAYQESKSLVRSDNWEKWAEITEELKHIDLRRLGDESLMEWIVVTDSSPLKELRRRSASSNRMRVEYLQAQIYEEFKKVHRNKEKKRLTQGLKRLNDDIIGDIIPVEIDPSMSITTLKALATIFYLRLQLAQVAWDDNETIYNLLCKDRFEQINKSLLLKYPLAEGIAEKIEILEQIQSNGLTLNEGNCQFALEEATKLQDTPDLTESQRLRLEWLTGIENEDYSQTIALLLPQVKDAFDIETLSLIQDFATVEDRKTIFDRFVELFNVALQHNDSEEIGKLLTLAAYWNSDPTIRPRLTASANSASSIPELSLPEKRVNIIAADVYRQIDTITGKYDMIEEVPA